MRGVAQHASTSKCLQRAGTWQSPRASASKAGAGMRTAATQIRRMAGTLWLYLMQNQGASSLLKRRQRRLRISETVSLGEKRSVAILEVDGQAFLVGSSGSQITLLATFEQQHTAFEQVLQASFERSEVR